MPDYQAQISHFQTTFKNVKFDLFDITKCQLATLWYSSSGIVLSPVCGVLLFLHLKNIGFDTKMQHM